MKQSKALLGALRYEFHMQVHRLSMWITFLFFAVFVYALAGQGNWTHWAGNRSSIDSFADWTVITNLFLPLAVGVLLADRLKRDTTTNTGELLDTLPGTLWARLLGKYLGCTLAVLVPMFIVYVIGIIYICSHWIVIQGGAPILLSLPSALALFSLVVVPGLLFVSAFSIALPAVMWAPLYQFLFVCYWFWGNALAPSRGLPTLSDTILTPLGGYMLAGFFGEDTGLVIHHATFLQGMESLLLLLIVAILVLIVLWRFLIWQRTRQ